MEVQPTAGAFVEALQFRWVCGAEPPNYNYTVPDNISKTCLMFSGLHIRWWRAFLDVVYLSCCALTKWHST